MPGKAGQRPYRPHGAGAALFSDCSAKYFSPTGPSLSLRAFRPDGLPLAPRPGGPYPLGPGAALIPDRPATLHAVPAAPA